MIFSYHWLRDYVQNLPRPEKLAELLTMKSFEVVELRKTGNDWVLDIDVLPNRAGDCFSHLGIARECAAILNSKFQVPNAKSRFHRGSSTQSGQIPNSKFQTKNFIAVEVRLPQACPRYTAMVVTDVKVGFSPAWMRKRLEVCGLRPINNIVDIANYVMLETGQPLHAFDGGKIKGRKIIVRRAQDGEKITTLDNQKFNLDNDILVIADAKEPIAIAGLKGGKAPEIDEKTKIVVLESANFDSRIIRQSSQKLGFKTDASLRFEHGLDPNLTLFAANRVAYLIQKIAGGKIAKGLVDVYPKKVYPKIIKLDLNYVESLLGIKIPEREVRKILEKLGLKIKNLKLKILDVAVPTSRLDISIPEDLIEEIGRICGYEKIAATFPMAALVPPKRNDEIFWEDAVKDILKELGFTEVYNYSFISKNGKSVEVLNPVSSKFKYLRPSLIPNLLKNIEENIRVFSKIKIFELGKVFRDKNEKKMLTAMVVGEDFYQLKGVIDLLLEKLGISNVWYDDYQPSPEDSPRSFWQPKKCAEIKVDGEEIGFLGELKEREAVAFDIDFEKLHKLASEETIYRPVSKFPASIRDIAILVPLEVRVEQVLNKIEIAGGKLLRDTDLFDIYEGEELPAGKKNLAFHIIYQAPDRTLTSQEVDKIHQKIIKTLEQNSTWQVRK